MAFTQVLPGFSASLYAQTGASPTPITAANLSVYATVNALCVSGGQIPVEAIPAFGQDDAVASYGIAGSRQGDKIPVQSQPTSMTVTCAWNPSDTMINLMRDDAASGKIDRTFIVKATDGTNSVLYSFNARIGSFQIDSAPGAEAKAIFTIHPRGNQFGWSYNP
jgi:hypothetical protein